MINIMFGNTHPLCPIDEELLEETTPKLERNVQKGEQMKKISEYVLIKNYP